MKDINTKQLRHISYLLLVLVAFGFLGLEFGVLFISRIIDGRA